MLRVLENSVNILISYHQLLLVFVVGYGAEVQCFHPFLLLASLFSSLWVFPPSLASSFTVSMSSFTLGNAVQC